MSLQALAAAIAQAEGVPAWVNNPGALVLGDQGYGVFNSAGVTIFGSAADGQNALLHQLGLVLNGQSAYENTSMNIQQFAVAWTGNDNPTSWANTVAGALGVPVSATIGQVLGLGGGSSTDPTAIDASNAPAPVDTTTDPTVLSAGLVPAAGGGISLATLAIAAGVGLVLYLVANSMGGE